MPNPNRPAYLRLAYSSSAARPATPPPPSAAALAYGSKELAAIAADLDPARVDRTVVRLFAGVKVRDPRGLEVQRLRSRLVKLRTDHAATWNPIRRALLRWELERIADQLADLTTPARGEA
jgi:hypothetical protein